MHIAFKCTYNDGGKGVYVGYNGTCSNKTIEWNINNGKYWCGMSQCNTYFMKGFKGAKPKEPCYESCLFQYWTYGAGWNHYGTRANTPRKIKKVEIGDIVILTTRFPNETEDKRRIIGLYRVGGIEEYEKFEQETMIFADQRLRIKLPVEEAEDLYFWDYYNNKNSGGFFWGQGLFRYLDDLTVVRILQDIRKTIKSESDKKKVDILLRDLRQKVDIDSIPEFTEAKVLSEGSRYQRVIRKRKYGPTGEGKNHRELKEWIANNPSFLGLKNVLKTEVEEHYFPSQDLPDIVFTYDKNKYAVIEIETIDPLPGAYQAIKYRALLCAEKSLDINTSDVRSFLIAWSIPENIKQFCRKYNIEFREKKI